MGTVVAQPAAPRDDCAVSDHDLVAAVRMGHERAFELLYERYHRRIAAYVYGMVNDYGRAEDVTQEVFISALRRMRDTERPIALKPWLYEIAKNACIDQFRRSRRNEEVSYDAEATTGALDDVRLASIGAGPDAAVDAKQQLRHLCGAFGGLSDAHHQILVMRELEGLSYREIGDRMGMSRGSVESTLFRARRRLSEEYEELVSGERCVRVRATILAASAGARDERRLLRHVAHCQPCRREARLAGFDVDRGQSRSVRDTVITKVAAFLPLPALLQGRRTGPTAPGTGLAAQATGPLSTVAEPVAAWTKALAAAVTVVLAGTGSAVVSPNAGQADRASHAMRAPAAAGPVAAARRAPAAIAGSRRSAAERGEDRRGTRSHRAPVASGPGAAPRPVARHDRAADRVLRSLAALPDVPGDPGADRPQVRELGRDSVGQSLGSTVELVEQAGDRAPVAVGAAVDDGLAGLAGG